MYSQKGFIGEVMFDPNHTKEDYLKAFEDIDKMTDADIINTWVAIQETFKYQPPHGKRYGLAMFAWRALVNDEAFYRKLVQTHNEERKEAGYYYSL